MKTRELFDWIQRAAPVSSIDIERWAMLRGGMSSESARRAVRRMVERNQLESLNWSQKVSRGLLKHGETEIAFYDRRG